jgi:hypothetical protein
MSKRVVKILMERDGLTEEEACERIKEVKALFDEANYNSMTCENILANELGLELDYLLDILL